MTKGIGETTKVQINKMKKSRFTLAGLTEIKQLQKLQNRAAKIAINSNYDTTKKKLWKNLAGKSLTN